MREQSDLEHAAELLHRLITHATPGPWRDSSVDGNQHHALIAEECVRDCDSWQARWTNPPEWASHPHEGYGGCLIAESQTPSDRRLMAVMRNVADDLAGLLYAVAHEDPIGVGRAARDMATQIIDTHTPREEP